MKEVRAEIDIEAPVEKVWQIMTDFAAYRQWNPYIQLISGEIRAGERIDVTLALPGGRTAALRPKISYVEDNRELRWISRMPFPWVFSSEHIFTLEPRTAEKHLVVRFIQRQVFRGLFAALVTRRYEAALLDAFIEMNHALKLRAEQG